MANRGRKAVFHLQEINSRHMPLENNLQNCMREQPFVNTRFCCNFPGIFTLQNQPFNNKRIGMIRGRVAQYCLKSRQKGKTLYLATGSHSF